MKYFKLIGILIFVYILSGLDYELAYESVASLKLSYVLIYCFSFFVFFLLKAYRWHLIQTHFSKPLKFRENLWLQIETVYLSYVTPGKLGDIAKLWIMKSEFGIDKKDSIFAYFFDRLQDLMLLLFFSIISLFFIIDIDVSNYLYIFLICLLCLYFIKNHIVRFVDKRIKITTLPKIKLFFELKLLTLSLVIFAVFFFQVLMLSKAIGLNIDYLFIVALMSISSLAVLIPISIGGLGVREGVYVYMLSTIGVTSEDSVILSLLDNLVFLTVFIVILHLFSKFHLRKML